MNSVPAELTLALTPSFLPNSITDFLNDVANAHDKLSKLDDFTARLKREMAKIDVFKRELPLCMRLLSDAISALKEESAKCTEQDSKPVLEEFIPLKKECDQTEGKECRDKRNWMSSVQLWNTSTTNNVFEYDKKLHTKVENKKNEERKSVVDGRFQCYTNRYEGRAFMPFSAYPASSIPVTTMVVASRKEEEEHSYINRLNPGTGMKTFREGSGSSGSRSSSDRAVSSSKLPSARPNSRAGPQQLQARKQRRSWSLELHRRFLNALKNLGGALAATPKQIRELMQVDGLTNDEVKSHLQKYRLHHGRVPSDTAETTDQSVVFLGDLRMSKYQCNDSSKGSSYGSDSPQLAAGSRGGRSPYEDESMEESCCWKTGEVTFTNLGKIMYRYSHHKILQI